MILEVTYTKGVGIILMVLCHSMFKDIPFIYMFHMSLFFFVSGYCFKEKYIDEPFRFVWQKVKGIYYPYAKWSIIFLLLHNVLYGLNIYNDSYGYNGFVSHLYTDVEFIDRIKSILLQMKGHEQLLGGLWFMKTLFWSYQISYLSIYLSFKLERWCRCGHNLLIMLSVVGLMICCLLFNRLSMEIPLIELGPREFLASSLFMTGYYFKHKNIRQFTIYYIVLSFALVLLGSFYWFMSWTMFASPYESLKLLPYMLTGVLATWAVYSLPWAKLGCKITSMLKFIGNNTLTILTWHFFTFKIVSLLIIKIYGLPIYRMAEFPVITDYASSGWWVAYFLVSMAVCCLIAYCNRFIKYSWLKL